MKPFVAIVAATLAELLVFTPWFIASWDYDRVVPIMVFFVVWFPIAVGLVTSLGKNGRSLNSQSSDYIALNQYFNNQAKRRDLDNMNRIATRTEIQSQMDRLNK